MKRFGNWTNAIWVGDVKNLVSGRCTHRWFYSRDFKKVITWWQSSLCYSLQHSCFKFLKKSSSRQILSMRWILHFSSFERFSVAYLGLYLARKYETQKRAYTWPQFFFNPWMKPKPKGACPGLTSGINLTNWYQFLLHLSYYWSWISS